MVVLTAIGRFFKRIWDWIKQTAWIQPLLIVGVIFGVIFSIPAIVKAVNASKKEKNTYIAYYHDFKLSLEGEADSEADKFTTKLNDVMNDSSKEEEFKKEFGDLGNKFFVAYVAKECDKCEKAKEGFSTFQDRFNDYAKDYEENSFHFVTIFTDDENADTTESQTAFVKYLERHQDFFASAGGAISETPYCKNELSEADVEYFETANPDEFLTPTIMLVELGESASAHHVDPGVTELMFGVSGETKGEKAQTLADCWNHAGDFSFDEKD